jgi:hypothetical protein
VSESREICGDISVSQYRELAPARGFLESRFAFLQSGESEAIAACSAQQVKLNRMHGDPFGGAGVSLS